MKNILLAYPGTIDGEVLLATSQEELVSSFEGIILDYKLKDAIPMDGAVVPQLSLAKANKLYKSSVQSTSGPLYHSIYCHQKGKQLIFTDEPHGEEEAITLKLTPGAELEFHKRIVEYQNQK